MKGTTVAEPNDSRIIDAVDEALRMMEAEFLREPTRFFTENDLVCRFHRIVNERLECSGLALASDRNGCPHSLVHCEYPTPFRCDMGGLAFRRARDDERTDSGGKFGRGHYDIAVLNPDVVKRHRYEEVRGQNYELLTGGVLPGLSDSGPLILYGLEFVFSRDAIRPFGGEETAVPRFISEVIQDAEKLMASVNEQRFMRQGMLLAFLFGTQPEAINDIRACLSHLPLVKLVAGTHAAGDGRALGTPDADTSQV
jgi:hypothetical protein